MFRAISFDFTGTLAYSRVPVGLVYAQTALRHGLMSASTAERDSSAIMESSFLKSFSATRKVAPNFGLGSERFPSSKLWWKEVVRTAYESSQLVPKALLESSQFTNAFEELYANFGVSNKYWTLYPEVLRVMSVLVQRGTKVAVLSDNDERLHAVVKSLGLLEPNLVSAVITSYEVGACKPHHLPFSAVLSAVGLSHPQDLLHVGDSVERDVEGARKFGCSSRLIDRAAVVAASSHSNRHDGLHGTTSHAVISSLEELLVQDRD